MISRYILCCIALAVLTGHTQAQEDLHRANQQQIDNLRTRLHTLANGGENTDSLILHLKEIIRQQRDSLKSARPHVPNHSIQAKRFNYSPACNCYRIFYGLGKQEANYATYTELDSLASILRSNPSATLRLTGHADHLGTESINQVLARKRAENLKAYLIKKYQVTPNQITTDSRGDREEITGITDPYLFHLNRRVEIFVETARTASP